MTEPASQIIPLQRYLNVLVDMDGTLVDSNAAHAHSFIDAFEKNGITHIQFHHIQKLIGMSGMQILCHVLDEETFTRLGEKINADRIRIFQERYMDQVQPFPMALPLLELLKTQGKRVAILSNSPPHVVQTFIRKLNIEALIDGATTSHDIPEGKPHPVAIEAACEKYGFAPGQTIYLGDSPYDVIAAHEFSMETIGVTTGGYSKQELLDTGALAVYADLGEIYQEYQQTVLNP